MADKKFFINSKNTESVCVRRLGQFMQITVQHSEDNGAHDSNVLISDPEVMQALRDLLVEMV